MPCYQTRGPRSRSGSRQLGREGSCRVRWSQHKTRSSSWVHESDREQAWRWGQELGPRDLTPQHRATCTPQPQCSPASNHRLTLLELSPPRLSCAHGIVPPSRLGVVRATLLLLSPKRPSYLRHLPSLGAYPNPKWAVRGSRGWSGDGTEAHVSMSERC